MSDDDLSRAHAEVYARALEERGDYRVLRKFEPREHYGHLTDEPFVGVYVDVEGTGLDTDEDRIIQFAGVRFEFDRVGNIGRVLASYSALEDPRRPLSPEIVALTGITDDDVRCRSIDDAAVAQLIDGASLFIAHNADYDRKMVEKRLPGFDRVSWGCSQRDVEWERFNCRHIGLEVILNRACGEFFTPHDALDDCNVGLHILATPRDADGRSPFQCLLASVKEPTLRLWAFDSAYHTKDKLRLRRFRWDADARCWRKDLKLAQLEAEQAWLLEHVYDGDLWNHSSAQVTKVSPLDRYSVRA